MSHPFTKIFESSLINSSVTNNLVLKEAEKIREKGYDCNEIYVVLLQLQKGRIDDAESEIIDEAVEEFSRHIKN
ncbi:MAG: hypothetical protein WDZ68_01845 [Candidatus Paceibacterota bacterium]